MFCFGNVGALSDVDSNILFKGDSSEEIDFKRDVILDEAFDSIADSDDIPILYEVGVLSLKESFGGGSFVSQHTVNHGDLLTIVSLDELGLR